MARRDFSGNAIRTTLATTISSSATTITLDASTGWPTGADGKFLVALDRGNAGEEKLWALSRSGNVLTLSGAGDRGAEGTTAAAHTAGVYVEHVVGSTDLDEANAFVNNPGVVGDITTPSTALAGSTGRWADAGHRHPTPVLAAAPRGVLSRPADITAAQTFNAGTTDVTGMTAITLTGDGVRRVRVSAHLGTFTPSAASIVSVRLFEGATQLGTLGAITGDTNTDNFDIEGSFNFVPAAGSHTYKVSVIVTATTTMTPTATRPAWCMAEDIGL